MICSISCVSYQVSRRARDTMRSPVLPHKCSGHSMTAEMTDTTRDGGQRAGVLHTMYAVIETGGKQYRVSPGQTVEVELLPAEPGSSVALDRVLLVSADGNTLVGQPT